MSYSSSGSGNIIETLINNSAMPIDVVYQYTILGSAPNSCSNLASVTVRVNPIPSLTSGTPPTAICSNGTFSYAPTSDSSGDINWTRATVPGISQTGASGIITSTITTFSETLTNTTSSPITVIYKVTLPANSLSCANTIDLPVVVNPLPMATIAGTTTVCKNNTSPIITFTGSNGIAPYTFTYKIDTGTNQTVTTTSGNSATLNVPSTNVGSFVYTLISVLDSSSSTCSQLQSGSATITVNPTPLLMVNPPAAVCSPNTVNLTTLTTGSDSGLSFTYWKDSLATLSYESPTIATAGLYYIKATNDTNGCFDIKSATVSVNPLPTASISGTSTVCQNGTQPIITFTGSNGTAPYTFTYSVNNGSSLTVTTSLGSSSALVLAPTTSIAVYNYKLISVQDASINSCSQVQTGSAIITVNSLPTASISSSTSACLNDVNPNITFTGSNGIAPYTFTYNVDGGSNQIITSTANSITLPVSTAAAGIFIYNLVSVSDSSLSACSQSQAGSTTVTINPLPIVSVNNPSICAGANAKVTATPSLPGTYSYAWTVPTGAGNPGDIASFITPIAGAYGVIVTNTATMCSSMSASSTVTVNPIPTVTVNDAKICAGLSATIKATPGLSGNYSYVWTVPPGATTPGNVSSFSASVAGTYSVVITNVASSCVSSSASGTVTIVPLPAVTIVRTSAVGTDNQTLCSFKPITSITYDVT